MYSPLQQLLAFYETNHAHVESSMEAGYEVPNLDATM